jgi:NAD(P)-dependent dehydrogenase (short-subunit alcohol dehydrogenase family)
MLARVASIELGPDIRVNTINPGAVDTPIIAPFTANPAILEKFMECMSASRLGQPEDYANLALFLCSDEASYITGSNVLMDGGGRNFGYPDIIPLYIASLSAQ